MRKTSLYLLLKKRELTARKRSQRDRRLLGGAARAGAVVASLAALAVIILVTYAGLFVLRDLPSVEILLVLLDNEDGELLQPTTLLARDGREVLFAYQDEDIERRFFSINPDEEAYISPQLVRSAIAAIEPDFWTSPGYDPGRMWQYEPVTVAETLVSELVLWDEAPSLARAARMRVLARQVVTKYGRAKTIEWYLNSAWFGRYAYGVESAAQLYLGKSATQVTLAESALLISLLDHPALNPLDAPEAAIAGQQDFLRQMLAAGAIRHDEYTLAVNEVIALREPDRESAFNNAGIAEQIEKRIGEEISLQRLRRGGLLLLTTLDADLQHQLACATGAQLRRLGKASEGGAATGERPCEAALLLPTQRFSPLNAEYLSAAGLIMNPRSGEVLAYFEPVAANGAQIASAGKYQPGSLLAPIVAFSAFTRGYSPSSLLWDLPPVGPEDSSLVKEAPHGPVNIRSSVANGYLNPIANLAAEIGAFNTWRYATFIGLTSMDNAPDDATPLLGGSESSLQQVAAAYSTLANSGTRSGRLDADTNEILPEILTKIYTPGGRLLWKAPAQENAVITSGAVAYLVNHVLSDKSARWPSLGSPNELEVGSGVAVTSGSAENQRQVWTVGYTPERLVLVWMGTTGDEPAGTTRLNERMAAGIWHALFEYIDRRQPFPGWTRPDGVSEKQVCSLSGMLPTRDCPKLVGEVFLTGNEPTQPDTLFRRVKINRGNGLLATVFTPPALVEDRVMMNVPPEARAWAEKTSIAILPEDFDPVPVVEIDPEVNITSPELFSQVRGKVIIAGSAGGEKMASYAVQVGEGLFPDRWLQLSESKQRVNNGTLAVWDTSGLSGLYVIRLSVVGEDQLVRSAYTQVTIDNPSP